LTIDCTDDGGASDVVLWLKNGGGKTSMLSLVFALLFPDARYFLGRSQGKKVEDYVQTEDVAHTVIEWERPVEGLPGLVEAERLVTGVVRWWPHRRSGEGSELEQVFYAFRSIAGAFTLDDLVFRAADKRVPAPVFVQKLKDAYEARPSIELFSTDKLGMWTAKLEDLYLHPKLFEYQRKMNADEGGATEFLNFDSGDKFVDLLLDIVIEAETTQRIVSNLSQVREKLEALPTRQRERDFITGVLQRVEPLRIASRHYSTARSARLAVLDEGAHLANRIVSSADTLGRESAALATRAGEHNLRSVQLSQQEDRLSRRLNRAEIILARFQLDAAKTEEREAASHAGVTDLVREAWAAAGPRLAEKALTARAASLSEALRAREAEGGLRDAYEHATTRLRQRLTMDLDRVRRLASDAAQLATEQDGLRERSLRAERDVSPDLVRGDGRLSEITEQLDQVQEMARELRDEGVLLEGESAHDAVSRLEAEDSELQAQEGTIAARRLELATELRTSLADVERTTAELAVKQGELAQVTGEHDRFAGQARAIAANPRLRDLAEHDEVDVIDGHQVLLESLARLITATNRELAASEVLRLTNQRALTWLEDESYRLLPPGLDTEAAIRALNARGIAAGTGWRYIATSVPAYLRQKLIDTAPHLASGVIVPKERVAEARALLVEEAVDPESVVVLTSAHEIERAARDGEGIGFSVHLSRRALYDAEAVPAEVEARLRTAGDIEGEIASAEGSRGLSQSLKVAIELLVRECPPGHLMQLQDQAAALEQVMSTLEAERSGARQRLEALQRVSSQLDEAVRRIAERRRTLAEQIPRARTLDQAVVHVPELQMERTELESAVAQLRAVIAEHRRAQEAARKLALEAGTEANRLTERAGRLDERLTALPHFEIQVPDDGTVLLEELEAAYEQLHMAYTERVTESDIAREAKRVAHELSEQMGRLRQYTEEVLRSVDELLGSNPGIPEHEREKRQQEAATLAAEAGAAHKAAQKRVDESQQVLDDKESVDPKRQADLDETPTTLIDAERVADSMRDQYNTAGRERRAAEAERDDARRRADLSSAGARLLRSAVHVLEAHGVQISEVSEDAGIAYEPIRPEQADGEVVGFRGRLAEVQQTERDAEGRYAELAAELRRFVLRPQFADVATRLVTTFRQLEREGVAQMAEQQEHGMRERLVVLEAEISEIEVHKENLVAALQGETLKAVGHLRAIGSYRIPAGLGDWANEPFIRIRIDNPDPAELKLRLRILIEDELAARVKRQQLDGLDLLKKAVRAANRSRPFEVTLLKPNTDLVVERTSASQVQKWSGGERLTAAILIYCVLLGLRTRQRGRQSDVLILDNPFGRANHVTLVGLQRRVAEVLGIQLIYLTGINDESALTVFGAIVRPFRNLADRRSGRNLVVPDTVAPARIYRREHVEAPGPPPSPRAT
jgi:hypothetical protein